MRQQWEGAAVHRAGEPNAEGGSGAGRRTGHSPIVPREWGKQGAVTVARDSQQNQHACGNETGPR